MLSFVSIRLVRPLILSIFVFCIILACQSSAFAKTRLYLSANKNAECVVLLHGLARSANSMKGLQRGLHKAGYSVLNIDYPSTKYEIETLVEEYMQPQIESLRNRLSCSKMHFATHSMGGILLRYYLKHYPLPELARVVMISPPNKGSELVDKLGGIFVFRWINGPAGKHLGTAADSLPNRLGPTEHDVAIITGNRSLNPYYSYLIPGDDDGKVAVNRARLEGMRAFKVVPKTHTFIAGSQLVITLVTDYLKKGHF